MIQNTPKKLNQAQQSALAQLSNQGVTEQHLLNFQGKDEFSEDYGKALEILICGAGLSADEAFGVLKGKRSLDATIIAEIVKNHRLNVMEAEEQTRDLNTYQLMALRESYSFGLRRVDLIEHWKPLVDEKGKSYPFEDDHYWQLCSLLKERSASVELAIRIISGVNGSQARVVVTLLKMGLSLKTGFSLAEAKEQVKGLHNQYPMLMAIEQLYEKGLRRAHFENWECFVHHFSPYEKEIHEFSYDHKRTLQLLIERGCPASKSVLVLSGLAKYHTQALDVVLADPTIDVLEARSAVFKLNFHQCLSLIQLYKYGLRPQDLTNWRPFIHRGQPERFDDDHMRALEYLLIECKESKETAMAKIAGVSKSDLWEKKFNSIEAPPLMPSVATARAAMFTPTNPYLSDIPQLFICPLSKKLMTDPVTASDGVTYEKQAIEFWLAQQDISPATQRKLKNKIVVPNTQLAISIHEWLEESNAQQTHAFPEPHA